MSSGGAAGEEEDVLSGMPPMMPKLIALPCLCQFYSGCGGYGYPKNDSHPSRIKLAATLLQDVRIRQEYDCHNFGSGHIQVYPGVQGAAT